jgi:hypothetical protein
LTTKEAPERSAGEGWDYVYGAGIILMILAFIVLLGYFTG